MDLLNRHWWSKLSIRKYKDHRQMVLRIGRGRPRCNNLSLSLYLQRWGGSLVWNSMLRLCLPLGNLGSQPVQNSESP